MANIHWPGLLAWSTKYHDGTAPSQFNVMSDEDKQFLQNALEAAFADVEDPNQVFHDAILKFGEEDRNHASMMTALEIMDRVCDDPDVARNAEKLGGVQAILDVSVDSTVHSEIRCRSMEIFALLLSNNPNIQEAAMSKGAMGKLLASLRATTVGSEERLKVFRTVVALVRNVDKIEEQFVQEHFGVGDIVCCLSPAEDKRTQEKAASFAQSLAHNGRLSEGDIARLAEAVARILAEVDADSSIQYRETVASCASTLADGATRVKSWRQTLKEATVARLVKVKQLNEDDAEQEVESLQACVSALK